MRVNPFTPIPFDSVNDALVLARLGYVREFVPGQWKDIGGPESGPKVVGFPDHEVWIHGNHYIIVAEEQVVEMGYEAPEYHDDPEGLPYLEDAG